MGDSVTAMTVSEQDNAEVASPEENRLKPKVGRIPVNLRLVNEEQDEADGTVWAGASRKGETQFMFFLVTLFVVVNITLVFLLSYRSKQTAASTVTPVVATPAATTPAPALAAPAVAEKTPAPESTRHLPPPPPAATVLDSPTPPTPSVAAPTPVEKSYVTPVSPESSKATAAPFHPVTANDHPEEPAPLPLPAASEPKLTVIQIHNVDAQALGGLSPAAASPVTTEPADLVKPAAASPAAAVPAVDNQDLLSVITKD